jgi:hypothetical protein
VLCDDVVDAILTVVGKMMKPGRDAHGGRCGRALWGLPLEREMCPWAISKYFGD